MYEVPRIPGIENAAARHILGGWQISGILLARTGTPTQLGQGATGRQVARPDYVGGTVYLDDYRETLRYLNRAAFAEVPIYVWEKPVLRHWGKYPYSVDNGLRAPRPDEVK